MSSKCLLCFSEYIVDTGDPEMAFACVECGAWGNAEDDVSNPAEEPRAEGQITRHLTDDPEDVFVPGWA